MQTALWYLALAFAALLALWPVALLAAAVHHALARRWRQVGQLAWLLPVWMIAASIGLRQLAPLVQGLNTGFAVTRPLWAGLALVVSVCCAGLAWALLIASVRRPGPPPAAAR